MRWATQSVAVGQHHASDVSCLILSVNMRKGEDSRRRASAPALVRVCVCAQACQLASTGHVGPGPTREMMCDFFSHLISSPTHSAAKRHPRGMNPPARPASQIRTHHTPLARAPPAAYSPGHPCSRGRPCFLNTGSHDPVCGTAFIFSMLFFELYIYYLK